MVLPPDNTGAVSRIGISVQLLITEYIISNLFGPRFHLWIIVLTAFSLSSLELHYA